MGYKFCVAINFSIISVNFQLFLWQQSNFINRFSDLLCLICLYIDHLHKLISPFSIEFIRMELRLQYVSIMIHYEISFTGTRNMFELN